MRRCWVEIDGQMLRSNLSLIRDWLQPSGFPRPAVMSVVKANGYGHGLEQVAAAIRDDTDFFGVANLEEAMQLLPFAQPEQIFILSTPCPRERGTIFEQGFRTWLSNLEEAECFNRLALASDKSFAMHVKLDTGMGRIGFPESEWKRALEVLPGFSGLEITGLATHLPSSDEDAEFTENQIKRFAGLAMEWMRHLPTIRWVHACNSGGISGWPGAPFNLARTGLALYGVDPAGHMKPAPRPALSWKVRVSLVRDLPAGHGIAYGRTFVTPRPMRVAVLAAGYADGYPRALANRGTCVLLNGKRCPVLGRITMDQIIIDPENAGDVSAGDTAELIGGTPKGEKVTAQELAERAGTIPWEIFTGIGARAVRESLDPRGEIQKSGFVSPAATL